MDLLDAITAYVRAAERGGFTAAARDLNVSQPHITRAVRQLEERLGVRLFQRSTRAMRLTDAGQEYLEKCRTIIAAIEDADQAVGHGAKALSGTLTIFAPVSLGRQWIVPHLDAFMQRHDKLDVRLILDDKPRDMIEDRIDVALRVGEIAEQTLRVRHLGDVDRVVVAAPAYWDRRGRITQPSELAAHESLIFDGTIKLDSVRLTRAAETVDVALNGRFRTNSSEAIQEAIFCGLGVSVAPWWLVASHVAAGRMERALDDWILIPSLPIHAAYPSSRAPSEKVRRFVDWLVFSLHANSLYRPVAANMNEQIDVDGAMKSR
jgi:DNA-binding transcriptional LysR family regulator